MCMSLTRPYKRPTQRTNYSKPRAERLPPGEGEIGIRDIVDQMPEGLPIALEVPMTALTAAEGSDGWRCACAWRLLAFRANDST